MSLTPEEQKVVAQIKAAQESGEDVFGDDEELVRDEPQADADEQPEQTEAAADEPTTEQQEAQAPAEEPPAIEQQAAEPPAKADTAPQTFDVQLPADHEQKIADLLKEKAQAFKKLMEGEMEADEFATIDAKVTNDINRINREVTRAETLAEANRQQAENYQTTAIRQLIARTKGEVDYAADAKAQKQFDVALAVVKADPDNAALDFAELIDQAHKVVAAQRGVTAKPAAPQAPASRKPDVQAPVTLRSLPSAGTQNTNGSVADSLARLRGQDFENAFAKLTPSQRAAMLDE